MSKLADRIRKATRPAPAPLGFRAAARPATAPSMLVIVRLSENEANKMSEAASKGADAVIVERADARKLKDAAKTNNIALGVRPARPGRETVSSLREAGADFAVIDPDDTPAEALLEEKIGYVLALHGESDDTALRLLGELGLDAVIVPAPSQPVTVERLLALRRVASLTRTPLLSEVPADIDATLLQLLRDSGAVGVIVPGSALGKLPELCKRIEGLPARGRRREEHPEAVLPAKAFAGHDEEDEDEDEDE